MELTSKQLEIILDALGRYMSESFAKWDVVEFETKDLMVQIENELQARAKANEPQ